MSIAKYRARLQEVDAQINETSSQILAKVAEDVRTSIGQSRAPSSSNEWLTPELLDTLWLLKNDFDEAAQLLKSDKLAPCFQCLERLSSTVAKFEHNYPTALLAVDVSRKMAQLRKDLTAAVNKAWHEMIELSETSLTVRVQDGENAQFVLAASNRLTESFIQRAFGESLIEPIINHQIILSHQGMSLNWTACSNPSVDILVGNIASLVSFCQTLPRPLSEAIPLRWGKYFISNVIQNGMIRLYPDEPSSSSFKARLHSFLDLETELKRTGWISTRDISHFVSNFDSRWTDHRRESYLLKLRELFRQSAPISEDARGKLIGIIEEDEPLPQHSNSDDNGWDWNEDEEEGEAEELEKPASSSELKETSTAQGQLIKLWLNYANELGIESHEPFYSLYRAVAAVFYGEEHLWAYADTIAFVKIITKKQGSIDVDQLLAFANENLRKFVVGYMDLLKFDILPSLFAGASKGDKAVGRLRSLIDSVAISTNDAGGATLRHYVLSQLLEQTAVYISKTILALTDIGEGESQTLAILITKVSSLAVYVEDPNGSIPSWTKLDLLRQLLTTNLATIEDFFDRGELADFDSTELMQLIKSLFRESHMRTQLIHKIGQA